MPGHAMVEGRHGFCRGRGGCLEPPDEDEPHHRVVSGRHLVVGV
jgi:hypothetical protein